MHADMSNTWVRYKENGDIEARNELILNYSYLVKYIANRLAMNLSDLVEIDELISYGIEGLIDAIDKYDYKRNIKFETYAMTRIRGSIIDGLRSMDQVPVSLRQKGKELEKTYAILESKLGRSATDEEVAAAMGISMEAFAKLLKELAATTILSLDDFLPGQDFNNKKRILDTLEDKKNSNVQEIIELNDVHKILTETLARLPEKEKLVVYLYYYEGLTLKEIGEVLQLSESRISQLHTKSIIRLRGSLSKKKHLLM